MPGIGKYKKKAKGKRGFKMTSPLHKNVSDAEKVKNLLAVDPKLRDEAYYAKVKEVTGADKVKSGGKTY